MWGTGLTLRTLSTHEPGRSFSLDRRAEVVNAEAHPTHEGYRHSLRWMDLTPDEQAALSRAILDAALVRPEATIRREMPQA